uniref:Deoxynucleoside kinase domain-containing protein n=1 Tax=Glossina brevipalpis TaxID=37001 RepID=A0A1A9WXT2_9MUSC
MIFWKNFLAQEFKIKTKEKKESGKTTKTTPTKAQKMRSIKIKRCLVRLQRTNFNKLQAELDRRVLPSKHKEIADYIQFLFMASNANCQPFTVLIEGNIGSGKTTFLSQFKQFEDQVFLISEPVEKWCNFHEHNLLGLMYSQLDKWAMPFQSYVNLTMLQNHTMQTDKPIKLMERSLCSSKYSFVENMYKNNSMEPAMYHILQEWYKFIARKHICETKNDLYRTVPQRRSSCAGLNATSNDSTSFTVERRLLHIGIQSNKLINFKKEVYYLEICNEYRGILKLINFKKKVYYLEIFHEIIYTITLFFNLNISIALQATQNLALAISCVLRFFSKYFIGEASLGQCQHRQLKKITTNSSQC